ncbi:hypothetical protein KL86PLE_90379 [uncultured Pleomorphomonas sp.]|uniref:Uncharacterized protein n=1 Tax=uncultured Pleomorphomonas sp. TaxID=442121 RepID=A0A212LPJ5_9HYPH|nr:hypothetical protein KL86PLE_90379 [uncultured Pleomorphomonas sp.]
MELPLHACSIQSEPLRLPGSGVDDRGDDRDREAEAAGHGAEAKAAMLQRLGRQVAGRRAERPRQDAREPESRDGIGHGLAIGQRNNRDDAQERRPRVRVTQLKAFAGPANAAEPGRRTAGTMLAERLMMSVSIGLA